MTHFLRLLMESPAGKTRIPLSPGAAFVAVNGRVVVGK
jgi:hypothetical protein